MLSLYCLSRKPTNKKIIEGYIIEATLWTLMWEVICCWCSFLLYILMLKIWQIDCDVLFLIFWERRIFEECSSMFLILHTLIHKAFLIYLMSRTYYKTKIPWNLSSFYLPKLKEKRYWQKLLKFNLENFKV